MAIVFTFHIQSPSLAKPDKTCFLCRQALCSTS